MAPTKIDEFSNVAAEGAPYFTPKQDPPAGTAINRSPDAAIAPLFRPISIRGVAFPNRIAVSPMCQYSAENGKMTPWHMAHLGGIFTRGPGLTIIEASAVRPEGRITPEDVGLWNDEQAEAMKPVVEFAHSQNQRIAVQIAHAGRKASMVAPWINFAKKAEAHHNGWEDNVVGPSALAYGEGYCTPRELPESEIKDIVQAFAAAAKRAVSIGMDVIEIHGAHGYLIHSFLSPVSNQRKDSYGGSFENRTRFLLEIVDAVRAAIPDSTPLFVRLSGDDMLDSSIESWTIDQTCRLAPILAEKGVDLIDISSAGLDPRQKMTPGPGYQVPLAEKVKKAVGDKCLVSAVGNINSGKLANSILEEGKADWVMVGRGFQKHPGLVWQFAEDLNQEIVVAHQIGWGFGGRGGRRKKANQDESGKVGEEKNGVEPKKEPEVNGTIP